MKNPIEYYYDKELSNEVPMENDYPIIDMKRTEINSQNGITVYVKNTWPNDVIVKTKANDEDLKIGPHILELGPDESKPLNITFKPDPERIEPLDTLLDIIVEIS